MRKAFIFVDICVAIICIAVTFTTKSLGYGIASLYAVVAMFAHIELYRKDKDV